MVQRKPKTVAEHVSQPLTYLRIVTDSRKLTSSERLVALAIMRHAGATGRHSHPGRKLLMAETGLSKNTVTSAAESLVRKKFLVQTYWGRGGRHDRANEYDLSQPVVIPKPNVDTLGTDPKAQMDDSQSPNGVIPKPNGWATDAFRDAPKQATAHHQQQNPDDESGTSTDTSPEDEITIESVVSSLARVKPEWNIIPRLLVPSLIEVCQAESVSPEELDEVLSWWHRAVYSSDVYDIPLAQGMDNFRNFASWIPAVLPDLVRYYRAESAAKAKELNLDDPAGFDYYDWCEQNCKRWYQVCRHPLQGNRWMVAFTQDDKTSPDRPESAGKTSAWISGEELYELRQLAEDGYVTDEQLRAVLDQAA